MKIERELMRGAGPVAVLKLLESGAKYGYELVDVLARQSDGVLAMGQSTLPPSELDEPLDLTGCLLQASVLLREDGPAGSSSKLEDRAELLQLTVVDGTRFVEGRSPQSDGQRVADGPLLHVVDAGEPYSAVVETGRWARLQGARDAAQRAEY